MRRSRLCDLVLILIGTAGLFAAMFALAADQMGVDADQKWGPLRVWLLVMGLTAFALPMLLAVARLLDRGWQASRGRPVSAGHGPMPLIGGSVSRPDGPTSLFAERVHAPDPHEESTHASGPTVGRRPRVLIGTGRVQAPSAWGWLLLAVLVLIVEALYVWLVSAGHWGWWPPTTRFYSLLSESFAQGQVHLMVEPPQALAGLENPYPSSGRSNIPVLSDASYYRGRYYAYWGPAPAVLGALWVLVLGEPLGDQHLVFAAVSSLFLSASLVAIDLWRAHFRGLPTWLLASALVFIATAHPMLWVLNSPSVYEAAIASGQAFLLCGLYLALPLYRGSEGGPRRLAAIGTLWAFALASRLSLAMAIVALIVPIVLTQAPRPRKGAKWMAHGARIAPLLVPLALGLGVLGAYNYVRFGDPLEPGLRYQLSVVDLSLLIERGELFSSSYLIPNLLHYVFTPGRLRETFPFIRPVWESFAPFRPLLARLGVPGAYRIEDIVGLLFSIPGTVFFAATAGWLVCRPPGEAASGESPGERTTAPVEVESLRKVLLVILGAATLVSAPTLTYFWVANRFLLEIAPLLVLAAAAGMWLAYAGVRRYPLQRRYIAALVFVAVAAGACASLLLSLTGADTRLDDVNPKLWEAMQSLFTSGAGR